MAIEYATFRGKANRLEQMIEQAALTGAGDPLHTDLYVNVQDEQLNLIAGLPGNVCVSYCTFSEGGHLDDVKVSDEKKDATEDGENPTAEAILDVADFLTYLDLASDGGTVEITLEGPEDGRLATVLEMEGALNTRIFIPASQSALEEMPLGTVNRFNGDNQLVSDDKGALPTEIKTSCAQVERIIKVVENDPELDFFPITVNDGRLSLNVGRDTDQNRNAVWGDLDASEVEGPDVANTYHEGFKPLFKTLNGDVRVSTAPGGAPLCVVQDSYQGIELRHIVGPTGQ